ncbi:MAG: competence/damage-inducible protein A, partial [Rhodospirillaceae bacterium]
MSETKVVTAALIIVGNEILSGRTRDANLQFLGEQLNELGIRMRECIVVPDVEDTIVAAVNDYRARFDYVFTTGGIGPTHDDITSAAVAKAFGTEVYRHLEAEAALLAMYKPEDVTPARMKMADVPKGASLIPNPVSTAPGFRMENVFTMAGVPRIMQAMFKEIAHDLTGGAKVLSASVTTHVPEGKIGVRLGEIQDKYPDADIGSYPFWKDGRPGTSLVVRHVDAAV